ncbi:MAG: hypothetical protein LBQ09_07940, partial [Acidobacteriaceae bacterium]|nr:hypothetical protein [Acidobacteriaceae bacterium]
MNDIASSLEQDFTHHAQAARKARLAELTQIASKGSGSVVITPHAIMLPLLLGFAGVMIVFASFSFSHTIDRAVVSGTAIVAACAWAMFGPRKPLFTLTEEGVKVKDTLLPWSSVENYSVTENSYHGFTTHTSIVLQHAAGVTPIKLDLFILFGSSGPTRSFHKKTGQYHTRLTLYAGAKGMNSDTLAQRIGE